MTVDHIIFKDLLVCQPDDGFRFGLDSVLLAWFATVKRRDSVLDAGAGSGVISALLARLKGAGKIHAIEIQTEMYECLKHTIKLNSFEKIITPVLTDLNIYKPSEYFDLLICNPPYRQSRTGKLSACTGRTVARFDDTLSVDDLLTFARKYVKQGGRICFSGISDRLINAIYACRKAQFEPKRLRFLHPNDKNRAKTFFIECVNQGGVELTVEPPFRHGKNLAPILNGAWNH
jgi:tRNA1Val (adenine37-N6)-methyltransferase